jgi:hypothetical protein
MNLKLLYYLMEKYLSLNPLSWIICLEAGREFTPGLLGFSSSMPILSYSNRDGIKLVYLGLNTAGKSSQKPWE